MAITLTTASTVKGVKSAESGDRTASDTYSNTSRTQWTDGTGAGAVNKQYGTPQTTLGTVADSVDLSGSLENAIGEAVVFTAAKVIEFTTPSTNTANVLLYGSTSFLYGTLTFPPGARMTAEVSGGTYWTVSAGTNDVFYVSGTSGNKYQHYLAGE